jgi:hypothetical protein
MGIGWLDTLYNNTDNTWYFQSKDWTHNGAVMLGTQTVFNMDDQAWHALSPRTHYHAEWCGIPWYSSGRNYKSISINKQDSVQFYTSEIDGQNWIVYQDGLTGRLAGKQGAPKMADFHCNFRIEDSGIFLDIVNADAQVLELGAWIYDQVKFWVPVALGALGANNKTKAGGSAPPLTPTGG